MEQHNKHIPEQSCRLSAISSDLKHILNIFSTSDKLDSNGNAFISVVPWGRSEARSTSVTTTRRLSIEAISLSCTGEVPARMALHRGFSQSVYHHFDGSSRRYIHISRLTGKLHQLSIPYLC
jgi:hypothetical protein